MKSKPLRRKPLNGRLKRARMDPVLRAAILDRSQSCCDLCRRHLREDQWQCHHRLRRSQGGQDSLFNLIALHTKCHAWVHNNVTWSLEHGFLVPSHRDPATWRVFRFRAVWMAPGAEWVLMNPHADQESEDDHG